MVTTADTDHEPEVWRWREQQLRKLGLTSLQAELLMDHQDIVRDVERLLAQGCPVELICRVLL